MNTIINAVYSYVVTNHDWPSCVISSTTTPIDVINCTNLVPSTNTLPRDPSVGTEEITGYLIQGIEVNNIIESITVWSSAPESEVSRTQ